MTAASIQPEVGRAPESSEQYGQEAWQVQERIREAKELVVSINLSARQGYEIVQLQQRDDHHVVLYAEPRYSDLLEEVESLLGMTHVERQFTPEGWHCHEITLLRH